MENPQIISPLNEVLTVTSAARLRAVSRMFRSLVIVKKYSFRSRFLKLEITSENITKMLFEYDQDFVENDDPIQYFSPIKNHILGERMKRYIECSENYWVIPDFEYTFDQFDPESGILLIQLICDHVLEYTDYHPLQGLLIEMCLDEYGNR